MYSRLPSDLRLGIMGGTFNPVHFGHLRAAEEIAESLKLDQVHFVPSASPPHKSQEPVIDYWRRLEMLKLAVFDRPGFWVSDLESRLSFPSYTVNTLKAFKEERGFGALTFFMVGLDSFLTVAAWRDYKTLFKLASFVVFGRAGTEAGPAELLALLRECLSAKIIWDQGQEAFVGPDNLPIYYRPGCRLEISSTGLRQRLDAGASVRYLVPEAVRVYIEEHDLYRPEASGVGAAG